jgi:hypothetical protein
MDNKEFSAMVVTACLGIFSVLILFRVLTFLIYLI